MIQRLTIYLHKMRPLQFCNILETTRIFLNLTISPLHSEFYPDWAVNGHNLMVNIGHLSKETFFRVFVRNYQNERCKRILRFIFNF